MSTEEKLKAIEKHFETISHSDKLTVNEKFLVEYIGLLKSQLSSERDLVEILAMSSQRNGGNLV